MAIAWDGHEVRSWQRIAEGERFFGHLRALGAPGRRRVHRAVRELRHAEYSVPTGMLRLRVHDVGSAPRSVTVDGRALPESGAENTGEGYGYDSARRIATVRVQEAGQRQEIRIR
jgi:hypothetical protein